MVGLAEDHHDLVALDLIFLSSGKTQVHSALGLRVGSSRVLHYCSLISSSDPDASSRPPPHSAGVDGSDPRVDNAGTLQRPVPGGKPHGSRRAKDKGRRHPQDVQSDQLQRAAALGPPGSPQGGRSPEPKGDHLKRVEQRLEQLAVLVDMLKTQVGLNTIIKNVTLKRALFLFCCWCFDRTQICRLACTTWRGVSVWGGGVCGRAVTWRTASAGRLTTACAHAHLERSNAKLTLQVKTAFISQW